MHQRAQSAGLFGLPVIGAVFAELRGARRVRDRVIRPAAAPTQKKSSFSKAADEIPSLSTQRMKDMFWK